MTGQRTGPPNQTSRSAPARVEGSAEADAAAPSPCPSPFPTPSGRAWNPTRGIRPVAVTRTFTICTDSSGFSCP